MLIDKLKEWEQEMPEGLHEQFGECRFCGQSKMLHTAMPWNQEDCNEAATEMCTCAKADAYSKRKRRKEKIFSSIEKEFGEKGKTPIPAVNEIMLAAAQAIIEYKIDSVTVKVNNAKYTMSMTSKGAVKTGRTVTRSDSVEVL